MSKPSGAWSGRDRSGLGISMGTSGRAISGASIVGSGTSIGTSAGGSPEPGMSEGSALGVGLFTGVSVGTSGEGASVPAVNNAFPG